jgi:dUTP pyrophosphatase
MNIYYLFCINIYYKNTMGTIIKIVNKSNFETPRYATPDSAGFDLRANIESNIILKPFERTLIKTGIFMEIPKGCVGYVCTRSGLAIKKGLIVLNAPGVVDADYRSEVGVILINLSNEDINIESGDRIAQMVVAKHEQVEWQSVETLEETERSGGFGSTGQK